ncbi:MAG: hypothetical protein ACOC59_00725 [Bacteroidota bacterium]
MVKKRLRSGIKVILVVLMSLLISCEEDKTELVYELNQADDLDEEIYKVFERTINQKFSNHEYIVLQQETDTTVHEQHCRQLYESETTDLDTPIIDNYLQKNQDSYNLGSNFDTDAKVKLVTRKEINSYELNSHEGWESFHNNYPEAEGVVYLSLPGFDSNDDNDYSRALFEYTWHTEMAESEHYMVYLRKKEGEWHMMVHENIDVQ